MKNKLMRIFTVSILFVFFILIFCYSKEVANSITFSVSLWKDNLLPSLFPFFLVSDLLLEYGFVDFAGRIFGKWMTVLFGLPKESSFALIASLFSGFPSGSKYVRDLLEKGLIEEEDANYLIMFTHYSNPLFITTTVGLFLLNNQKMGYIILIAHIVSNLMVAFLFRRKRKSSSNQHLPIIKRKEEQEETSRSFVTILVQSIWKSFKILINMLGIIMFFLMITTLIGAVFHPSKEVQAVICGILEMTQGVKYLSGLNGISLSLKAALIGSVLSFSGISVHFQVKSIIDGSTIRYQNFLLARILQSIFTFFLILLFSQWI